MKRLFCYLTLLVAGGLNAAEFDYGLKARQIAPDVHVFVGRTEDFTPANGGNIVNTGFIVAPGGTIVIDSGSSVSYTHLTLPTSDLV